MTGSVEASRRYREKRRKPCPSCGVALILAESKTCAECRSPAKRFLQEALVSATDACIEWPFSRTHNGYGRVGIGTRVVLAHRRSFELAHRPLEPNEWVLHTCDNRSCVNRRHLVAGDRRANTDDMLDKGRQSHGDTHGSSKLNTAAVREIRRQHDDGVGQRELSRRFGVSQGTIGPIVRGRTWRDV